MNSKSFVTVSSVVLLAWLGASFVTELQPTAKRNGATISSQEQKLNQEVAENDTTTQP